MKQRRRVARSLKLSPHELANELCEHRHHVHLSSQHNSVRCSARLLPPSLSLILHFLLFLLFLFSLARFRTVLSVHQYEFIRRGIVSVTRQMKIEGWFRISFV